jgi:hypothetical protein
MNGHAIHTRQEVGSERFGESSLSPLHLNLFLQELFLIVICRGTDVGIVGDWVILTGRVRARPETLSKPSNDRLDKGLVGVSRKEFLKSIDVYGSGYME